MGILVTACTYVVVRVIFTDSDVTDTTATPVIVALLGQSHE